MSGFAALYAVLFGIWAGMTANSIAADGITFMIVLGLEIIVLWNITNYIIPIEGLRLLRGFMIVATAMVVIASTVGAETLAVYIYSSPHEFRAFAASIPSRVMVTAMAFVIMHQYYLRDCEKNRVKPDELCPVIPARPQEELIERITIRGGKNIKVINVGEIIYIQADGDYVAIVTSDGRWLKEQTMKYFEEHLPYDNFVRVHRSYIVNLSNIVKLERYGNLYQISLRNGENIKVSANGYKLLKASMRL